MKNADRKSYGFGNGFDFVMASPDYRRFRGWWNRNSFFPVSSDEAETILSTPQMRLAA